MLIPEIEGIIHVPGLRGNPERTYTKTTSVGPNFPGTFENYVASVVAQWQSSDGGLLGQLGKSLEELGLTWKVDARSVDDTRVELRVGRLLHGRRGGAHDMVNIADVGFGVSQTLPVLVALLAAHPGQIVYLEQPEIHLHPLAQRRLAGIVASAAKRGVRVVMETHSSLLLREVQTLVAAEKMPADLVKLHWFKRNPEDGITELFTADLDANGAYGEWPEDFDDVHLDSEKAYLDAVEQVAGRE
jgi:predicted ATPase